jgi:hypothetical protein
MKLEQSVARHYTHGSLEAAILEALTAAGKDLDRLAPADLAPVDEFHIGDGRRRPISRRRLGSAPVCTSSTSATSRGATAREPFGVGIAMTVEKPSPTSSPRSSGQRAAGVVPLSVR